MKKRNLIIVSLSVLAVTLISSFIISVIKNISIIKNRDKTFFINNTAKYMPLCFRHSGKEFQTVVNLPFRNTRIFFREDFQYRLKR